MKSIVVTGGTGFIGTRVVPRLVAAYPDAEIVCFIRNVNNDVEARGRAVLAALPVKTIKGDLVSGAGLEQLPRSPDLIINLAANTNTDERDHSCNDSGVENLYHAIEPLNSSAHFMQISTTALLAGRHDTPAPFREETTPVATNEYGRSKLRGEQFITEAAVKGNFRITICRLTTVWGAGMRPNSFFDVLKQKVRTGSAVTRLNWPGLTDLIHVDDVADLIVALSKSPPPRANPNIVTLSHEAMTLAAVNRLIHKKLQMNYRPINLPGFFWRLAAASRRPVHSLERLIPATLYNTLWRATLVADNVIYDVDRHAVITSTPIIHAVNWAELTPNQQPFFLVQKAFVTGNSRQLQVLFKNGNRRPIPLLTDTGQLQVIALGPSSQVWTRYPRIVINAIQKIFITAVMLPFMLIGAGSLIYQRRLRTLGLLIVLPVYYMCIQSALWTEFRYVLPMYYVLFILAAAGCVFTVQTLAGLSGRRTAAAAKPDLQAD